MSTTTKSKLETFTDKEQKDTRSGFGLAMDYLGETNPKVMAMCADLTGSLKLNSIPLLSRIRNFT